MGICHSQKSIEQIIHSKYTLAKQTNKKDMKSQSNHVYIWKYAAQDLIQKNIVFYDPQRTQIKLQKDLKDQQQHLIGQPLKWPFKVHSDEGYIVLTIKNHLKQIQHLSNSEHSLQDNRISSKKPSQLKYLDKLHRFGQSKYSLQLLEILYMVHLDSFKSYYFTQIKQQNAQFQVSIEIITGDLLQKIDCLKLVSIAYQLQKYIKLGGQNIIKKFYNEFQQISYFNQSNQNNCNNQYQFDYNQNVHNNMNRKQFNNIVADIDIRSQIQSINEFTNQTQIIKIIQNDLKRISNSAFFKTQQQKQQQIQKLFENLFTQIYKFLIFRSTILKNFNNLNTQITQKRNLRNNNSKSQIGDHHKRAIQAIIKRRKQNTNLKQVQNQKVFICQTYNEINSNNANQNNKNTKNKSRGFQQKDFKDLDLNSNDISMIEKQQNNQNFKKSNKNQDLDMSSPFMCQITQINAAQQNQFDNHNGNEKGFQNQKQGFTKQKTANSPQNRQQIIMGNGQIQDSLFLPKQLQQLRIDRNIYKIVLKPSLVESTGQKQCPVVLSTYTGSSNYSQLMKNNVTLIINLTPNQCYNYFINDIRYQWYYIQPLNEILPQEKVFETDISQINRQKLYLYNIQCLVYDILQKISNQIQNIEQGEQDNQRNKICIFCNHKNMIYSGTMALAYLMFSNKFRIHFDQAYQIVRQSTNNKFILPKIYQTQLQSVLQRIQSVSSAASINQLNSKSTSYRTFQIGLYSKNDASLIVPRYIGQLTTSSQLQLLQNNYIKAYFLVPNNLTSILIKTLNIMRQDTSISNINNMSDKISTISKLIKNMGLNLRLFYGKQLNANNKQIYSFFIKSNLLPKLIKFQYLNFQKKIFNVQKYKSKVDIIIESIKDLITFQTIQKSFRRPQQFDQLPLSNVSDFQLLKTSIKTNKQQRIQPFNTKQTLVFKYPILRPIFQSKKKDCYYFMIRKTHDSNDKKSNGIGCNVTFYKGQNWIGLQEDKQRYFQKIVEQYLRDINQEKIWIQDNEQSGMEKSLFDGDSLMF